MSERLIIRPRRPHRRRPVRALFAGPALAGAGAQGTAPRLVMDEPASRREALLSGALSAGLHALLLIALLTAAALAPPELIERIIPVEIVKDVEPIPLPGSNETPAPTGPKAVGALRPSAAAMAAAQMTPEQAEALRQAALEAARRAVRAMESEAREPTRLPTQIERREVQAQSLAAHAAAASSPTAAIDASDLEAPTLDPSELAALDVDLSGPQQIDTANLGELSTGQAMNVLSELGQPEYDGSVTASSLGDPSALGGLGRRDGSGGSGLDTGVATAYSGAGGDGEGVGGGGSGGAGTARGVVRCLESQDVTRYMDAIRDRTNDHWRIPEGVRPDAQVKLRFDLDAAGMATGVEVVSAEDALLGESATRALLAASPFPPMDDRNRCLSEKRITATFTVPARP